MGGCGCAVLAAQPEWDDSGNSGIGGNNIASSANAAHIYDMLLRWRLAMGKVGCVRQHVWPSSVSMVGAVTLRAPSGGAQVETHVQGWRVHVTNTARRRMPNYI